MVVGDLSFISQTLVLPAVVPFLKAGGTLLTLVKPQFELQPGQVGKGGIVKDDSHVPHVEQRLREACAELDLTVTAWFDSPIEGGDGNREFFIAPASRVGKFPADRRFLCVKAPTFPSVWNSFPPKRRRVPTSCAQCASSSTR